MMGLTKRQSALYHFIEQYVAEHGFSPTLREMSTGIGLSTTSLGSHLLQQLEERGRVRRRRHRTRGVELIPPVPPSSGDFSPPSREQLATLPNADLHDLKWLIAGILTERGCAGPRLQATTASELHQ